MAPQSTTSKPEERVQAIQPPPGLAAPPGLELPLPSLAPPPGLEGLVLPSLAPPPGLEGLARADEEDTVWISNLPNNLCKHKVLQVTFQQAQLEKFVSSFVTKPGVPCGEAHVKFTDRDAALRCARHFHGRNWGGFRVSAELLQSETSKQASLNAMSADAPVFVPTFEFSVGAPAFTPMPEFSMMNYMMAPEFSFMAGMMNPMLTTLATDVSADDAPLKVHSLIGSDVSTEDEASGSEDDKELDTQSITLSC